jgi:hypothetical protein
MPDGLYERDFYSWTREQARLLRAKAELFPNDGVDWSLVAEEIEDMGKGIVRTIRSAYARIIEHLLKLEWSPAVDPRSKWRRSVLHHRTLLIREIEENPGLRQQLGMLFAEAWTDGRRLAALSLADEDGIDPSTLPADCPWTREQVEDFDWWPVSPPAGG